MLHDDVDIVQEINRLIDYAEKTENRQVSSISVSSDYMSSLSRSSGFKKIGALYSYRGKSVTFISGRNLLRICI